MVVAALLRDYEPTGRCSAGLQACSSRAHFAGFTITLLLIPLCGGNPLYE